MLSRLMLVAVVVPLAVVLIALAVANRGPVAFTADLFNPGNPALTVELPLFVLLFCAIAIGLVLGSVVTWLKQGRYRKQAKQRSLEAASLRSASPPRQGQPALPKA